jgi:2'-5' RNA ligase
VESAERSTLLFDQLMALPRASKARVIVLSAPVPGALCALVAQLELCLAELGFAPETRPFFAHLTLGRAKRRARLIGEHAPTPPRLALDVDEIILTESRLGPQGPVYLPRARWTIPPRGPTLPQASQ